MGQIMFCAMVYFIVSNKGGNELRDSNRENRENVGWGETGRSRGLGAGDDGFDCDLACRGGGNLLTSIDGNADWDEDKSSQKEEWIKAELNTTDE